MFTGQFNKEQVALPEGEGKGEGEKDRRWSEDIPVAKMRVR